MIQNSVYNHDNISIERPFFCIKYLIVNYEHVLYFQLFTVSNNVFVDRIGNVKVQEAELFHLQQFSI